MAEGASPRRSDRVLVVIFALIGAAAGFYWLFVLSASVDPVSIVIGEYTLPGPHPDATLTVTFFRRFGYTRTAPDVAAFNTEVMFWQLATFLVPLLGGALGGGLMGYLVGRWPPRTHY